MYVQKRGNKYRFFEKYKNYRTGQYETASVTLEKDNNSSRITAANMLSQIIKERQEAPDPLPDLTFEELVEKYRAYQKKAVKPQTYKRNYHAAESLTCMFGKKTLVNNLDAAYVKERLLKSGKKNSTLNEHIKRFKALIRWAYENDLVQDKFFLDKIKPFPDVPHRVKIQDKYLEKEELQALLENVTDKKWNLIIRFMCLTGMRFGEVAALEKLDIDMPGRYIHVTKNYEVVTKGTGTTKTYTSARDVYIQEELWHLLINCLSYFNWLKQKYDFETPLFFFDVGGEHIQLAAFNKYLREHNPTDKKITSHIFRHTHTALLAEEDVPLETIARRLGHANSKTTRDIYFHITNKIKQTDNEMIKDIKIIN